MKTFASKEKRSAPAVRKTRPYVHHPMGPVQQAQRVEIRRILRSTDAQAKLNIGQPNDKYEQEADRVADQVMAIPDTRVQRQPEGEEEEETVQAKPLADQITPLVQRQEESPEEEEEETLQTKPLAEQITSVVQRQAEEEEEPLQEKSLLQRQPEEEEEEPIQAKLIQRQPDNEEEEEPVQAKRIQLKVADVNGILLSRFGYRGPEVKAQQAEIRRILYSTGALAKLTIGQPNDKYEQEADRVADQVMAMPDPKLQRQPENAEEEEILQTKPLADQITPLVQRQEEPPDEEEEELQTKSKAGAPPTITPNLEARIKSLKGGGQPLDLATRAFFEPRFGYDFSHVRTHTDITAADTAKSISAKAFTMGGDVVFGSGEYQPQSKEGKRLLGHELTHVGQQNSERVIQRNPDITPNLKRLRNLLKDDREDAAIILMDALSSDEVREVLGRREFKELAISAFNDNEMYRAIRVMRGDLYPSLEWMFDEGTNWIKVSDVITKAPSGKARVRTDNWMKNKFVSICNDKEMAKAVDLLGGTLLQKLTWMKAEGSNWSLVKARLLKPNDPQNLALYGKTGKNDIRDLFVDLRNDKTMAEAVDLLGGTLFQKLTWMKAEGSNWSLVRAKLRPPNDPQNLALYGKTSMRDFFVDVCNDKTMAEAVDLLGGTLLQKLTWMKAEGSNWSLVKAKLRPPNDVQNLALYGSAAMKLLFVDICDDKTMVEATRLLGGTVVQKTVWMKAEGVPLLSISNMRYSSKQKYGYSKGDATLLYGLIEAPNLVPATGFNKQDTSFRDYTQRWTDGLGITRLKHLGGDCGRYARELIRKTPRTPLPYATATRPGIGLAPAADLLPGMAYYIKPLGTGAGAVKEDILSPWNDSHTVTKHLTNFHVATVVAKDDKTVITSEVNAAFPGHVRPWFTMYRGNKGFYKTYKREYKKGGVDPGLWSM